MASSGIKLNPECREKFTAIKEKHAYGHALMKIDKDFKEVVVDKVFPQHPDKSSETSQQLFNEMKQEVLDCGEPRYILFDFSYKRKNGTDKDVVVYIYWCSDDCNVTLKQKMVYASTNDALKKAFTGIKHLECHDDTEFSYDEIAAKLSSRDKA